MTESYKKRLMAFLLLILIFTAPLSVIVSSSTNQLEPETESIDTQIPQENESRQIIPISPRLMIDPTVEPTIEPTAVPTPIPTAVPTMAPTPEPTPKETLVSLGTFSIYAYDPCKSCSGPHGHNTATGVRATEGRTIAVDPTVIPYGSIIVIDGHEYVAEDCGSSIKGNKIDIFMESHEATINHGVKQREVFMKIN